MAYAKGKMTKSEEWVGFISKPDVFAIVKVNVVPSQEDEECVGQGDKPLLKESSERTVATVAESDFSVSDVSEISLDDISSEICESRLSVLPSSKPLKQLLHLPVNCRTSQVPIPHKTLVAGPRDVGFPGYLTPSESAVLELWRAEIDRRRCDSDHAFLETVFCFGPHEPEEYALCRWLRSRKFCLPDVIRQVEAAAKARLVPRAQEFYPDPKEALGVEESTLKTQYPQCYTGGRAKNGDPLFFNKAGSINVDGVGALTTQEGLNKYRWHTMNYVFKDMVTEQTTADPTYTRYQSCVVIDLEHLSRAQLNGKVIESIKQQSLIDALCFPETLGSCIIINAPAFFSAAWMVIKQFFDPTTVAKIEIFSFKSSGLKRLRELIDDDQLPSDYGGKAPSIAESIMKQEGLGSKVSRYFTKVLHVKSHSSVNIELLKGEEMDVQVFTKSTTGATFTIKSLGRKSDADVPIILVRCPPPNSNAGGTTSYKATIGQNLRGPGKYKVHAVACKDRDASENDYLVVANIRRI